MNEARAGTQNPHFFNMECRCGGGPCRVQPVILNPRFLFVCCPNGQAGHGGCGFMQWRDTKELDNVVTWNPDPDPDPDPDRSPSPPSTPPRTASSTPVPPPTYSPLPKQDGDGGFPPSPPPPATVASPTPVPPPTSSPLPDQDAPHVASQDGVPTPVDLKDDGAAPWAMKEVPRPTLPCPELMCPCGAGACSVGFAKNGRNFYSCSACKFIKWCDEGSSNVCFVCREEGHWSKDCPKLPPSAAAAAANNKTVCFYCKTEGHCAAQCPSKCQRRN